MADSFHFSVNIISRGKGKSAVASAAYISGEKIKNEWDGVTHDYTKKQGVISKEIYLPDHAPEEYKDRKTLWNSVELFEKNSNAQLARNFIISLPKELSIEENKKMIEEYVQNNFVKEGMVVDLAIHDDTCHNRSICVRHGLRHGPSASYAARRMVDSDISIACLTIF